MILSPFNLSSFKVSKVLAFNFGIFCNVDESSPKLFEKNPYINSNLYFGVIVNLKRKDFAYLTYPWELG